jgi:hypothetical protein
MTHWLEEAELEKQDGLKKKKKVSRNVIQQKTEDIRQNYKANNEVYDGFINAFFATCQRANNLPPELREPWGLIESKAKENKMDNHLYSFISRERFDMRVPTKSFPFMKLRHFKHVRKIMFSISKDMGMTNIEVFEDYVAKTRLNKVDGTEDKPDKYDGLDRFHLVYHYAINMLDNNLALKILDWLAFKEEIDHLPFKKDQIKRVGKRRTA